MIFFVGSKCWEKEVASFGGDRRRKVERMAGFWCCWKELKEVSEVSQRIGLVGQRGWQAQKDVEAGSWQLGDTWRELGAGMVHGCEVSARGYVVAEARGRWA